MPWVTIIIGAIVLMALETVYIAVARRMGRMACAMAPQQERLKTPVVGGGIIFFVAAIAAWRQYTVNNVSIAAIVSLTALAVISMIDDIKPQRVGTRLCIQTIACISPLIIAFTNPPSGYPEWLTDIPALTLTCIFLIGFMNAYNFMDGINGITVAYTLVVLCSLIPAGISIKIAWPLILAACVFAIFNFRRHAIAIAGDVGTITMGACIGTLLISSDTWPASLLLVAIYLTDSTLTIISRIIRGKNIFHQHREHMYQLLIKKLGMSQLCVAAIYALLQTVINIIFLSMPPSHAAQGGLFILTFVTLLVTWICIHHKLLKLPDIQETYLK